MCGIFAIYDTQTHPSNNQIAAILQSMAHRGPDGQGIYCEGPVGLGHRRLSIIDIDGGAQPIWSEDKQLAIICNGEIYDHRSLRADLQARGHRFKTQSDSEVLLHLFEEQGPAAFGAVNGMFAALIYVKATNQFYIARDRFGQKPLFYSHCGTRFACASGPEQLCALPWVEKSLNYRAINWYLQYLCFPEPHSIYNGIKKVPAGSYAQFNSSDGSYTTHSYFTPTIAPRFNGSLQDASAEAHSLLKKSIQRRLVSDVPVGVFLSGGLDSSLIASIASELHDAPLNTFSIGFKEAAYDERDHAQCVADAIGSRHHFLEVDPSSWENLTAASATFEEPFADSSLLPTLLLSKFAKEQVTVALGGDGADELGGGYYRYQLMRHAARCDLLPQTLRGTACRALKALLPTANHERSQLGRLGRLLDIVAAPKGERYLELISRFKCKERRELYRGVMREAMDDDLLPLGELDMTLDIRHTLMQSDLRSYLNNDILVKVDRASMAHALEVRAPFLDREFSDFMLSLPVSYTAHSTRKRILHHLGKELLPAQIYQRRKMGFGVPLAHWYRDAWFEKSRHLLGDSQLLNELFNGAGITKLLDDHRKGHADNSYQLFALTMLALWAERS